jgi:hypothetical protein
MTLAMLPTDRRPDGAGARPVENPAVVIDHWKIMSAGVPAGAALAADVRAGPGKVASQRG